MAQPRPDIVVKNSDIRKYFKTLEWREMSDYEKEQIRNVMRNYLVMTSIGFKAPLPFFITDFEARQDQASIEKKNSSSASAKIKRCHSNDEEATTKRRGRPPKNKLGMTIKQGPKRAAPKSHSQSVSKTATPPPTPSLNPMISKEIGRTRQQPPRLSKMAGGIFMKNTILAWTRKKYFRV